MIEIAGDPSRLRPHVKTHKMAEIINLQMQHGIGKFKCATLGEAELLGQCGCPDVLLAMQPVGPQADRLFQLMLEFPDTHFSTLVDDSDVMSHLSGLAARHGRQLALYIDLNVGMDRTGIEPGAEAKELFVAMHKDNHINPSGFHVYDGHLRQEDINERQEASDLAFEGVLKLKKEIQAMGIMVPEIVAGGSPTFPIHAQRKDVQTSPGTTLLWDERYGSSFKDLPFLPAAVLLTRVVSKPRKNIVCLDLGHKSIAPEMDFPRARIFGLEDCDQISQSEEHLVLKGNACEDVKVGDSFYALPMHICPTVAKYPFAFIVKDGEVSGRWSVAARDSLKA